MSAVGAAAAAAVSMRRTLPQIMERTRAQTPLIEHLRYPNRNFAKLGKSNFNVKFMRRFLFGGTICFVNSTN
jgi:hypothetical protein